MNIFMWIIIVFGGALGIISSVGIIAVMLATIALKIYRRFRYGTSLFN